MFNGKMTLGVGFAFALPILFAASPAWAQMHLDELFGRRRPTTSAARSATQDRDGIQARTAAPVDGDTSSTASRKGVSAVAAKKHRIADDRAASEEPPSKPELSRSPANVFQHEDDARLDGHYAEECGDCDTLRCSPWWVRGEYLSWWSKGFDVPPLVTTAPTTGTGIFGAEGTTVAFGNTAINDGQRSGGRLTLGYDLLCRGAVGIEANYLLLDNETTTHNIGNVDGTIVARPFFNTEPATGNPRQDAHIVSQPNVWSGNVSSVVTTRFQGGEFLLRHAVRESNHGRMDFLAGYRYNRLDDGLRIGESLEVLNGSTGLAVGTTLSLFDQFNTTNDFHGADVGMAGHWRRNGWTLDLLAKVAFGGTLSETSIDGGTVIVVPGGGTTTSSGGLLTQPSNIGRRTHQDFAVIPELGLNVGYDLTPRLRATAGYSFIYWSRVARPGDQIDFDLNLTQQPPGPFAGAPRPEFSLVMTDFWAQGINVGLEYRY